MAQNEFLILREIRTDPYGYTPFVKRRLRVLSDRLASFYVGTLKNNFRLRNTSVILIHIDNSDTMQHPDVPLFSLGRKGEWIGAAKGFLSEKEITEGTDQQKREMLVALLHNALLKFAASTGHSTEQLMNAYQNVTNSDYYENHTKDLPDKNREWFCTLQVRENWGSADYRLVARNTSTNEI